MRHWLVILNLLVFACISFGQTTLAITENLSLMYDTTIFSKTEDFMQFKVKGDNSISITAIKMSGAYYTKPNATEIQSQFNTFYNLLLDQQSDTFNIISIDSIEIGRFPTTLLHIKTKFTPETKAQPGIAIGITCHFSDVQFQVIATKSVKKFSKTQDEKLLEYTTLFLQGFKDMLATKNNYFKDSIKAAQEKLNHWQDSVSKIYFVSVKSLPVEYKYYYKNKESGEASLKTTSRPDTLGFEHKPKYGDESFRGQFIISPTTHLSFKTFDFDKEGATVGDDYAIFRSFDKENLVFTLRHFASGPKKMSGHLTLESTEGYTIDLPFSFEYYCGEEFEE